jgi:predicted Zn-dependent protease
MQAYYHHAFGQLYAAAFRNQPNLDAYYEGYKSLTEAIRHNPREPQFYMTMADLHRNMFRQKLPTRPTAENAIKEYRRALEVDPFNPFIRLEMATLYAESGEFDQAIHIIQSAIADEPNFVGGHQLLGEFMRHLKRETEANEAFARAEQIRQTYPAHEHEPGYTQALLRPLRQEASK